MSDSQTTSKSRKSLCGDVVGATTMGISTVAVCVFLALLTLTNISGGAAFMWAFWIFGGMLGLSIWIEGLIRTAMALR